MRTDFFIDLCFIRESAENENFLEEIEKHMEALFSGKGYWYMEEKRLDQLEVIVAEVKGTGVWKNEEEVAGYLEKEAVPPFWDSLQAYRVKLEVKENMECSHCESERG